MKTSSLLPVCSGLLTFFTLSIHASPVRSPSLGTLQPRQAGTYDGKVAGANSSVSGTYHCFRGGTWMAQSDVLDTVDQACGQASHQYDNAHFSFVPSADGTYAHQQVDHHFRMCTEPTSAYIPPVCGDTPNLVSYQGDFKSSSSANTAACTFAMKSLVTNCHGDHQDTRGGWFQFDADGTTYEFDPTSRAGGE